ncbi:MAG: ACP S-malonyltransferase [Gammaproteobacteria bacterium]|nr:ACP S-malonyltransferase [Gammaproteobacteria bacterium]
MTTVTSHLAFVFPGQGSQSLGMLSELAGAYPIVTETFAEASAVLGYDLWQLVQQGPETQLNQTEYTQPAMLAAGVAVWRIWQQQDAALPSLMAGHSLGEYSALVCAGAVEFATAISLVAQRGRLMQQAVPEGTGAMAALLGLDDVVVIEVCAEAAQGQVVAAVNFNSPGQVVIAGHKAAVERANELAKARGAKRALMLPVSVPSHCALMKPAAEQLLQLLQRSTISVPRIPVINNVDVRAEDEPATIRLALSRQLYSPVRWVETVQSLAAQRVTTIIECGPGKVLAGLNKRIAREVETLPVYDKQTLEQALTNTGA